MKAFHMSPDQGLNIMKLTSRAQLNATQVTISSTRLVRPIWTRYLDHSGNLPMPHFLSQWDNML